MRFKVFVCIKAILAILLAVNSFADEKKLGVDFFGGTLFYDVDRKNDSIIFKLKKSNGEVAAKVRPCESDGGSPFFLWAYASLGGNKYLTVTCYWDLKHGGLGVSGRLYQSRVYLDILQENGYLQEEKRLSRILGGFEGVDESGVSYFFYDEKGLFSEKFSLSANDEVENPSLILKVLHRRFVVGDKLAIVEYAKKINISKLASEWVASHENVGIFNDIGYFLCESGVFDEGLVVLRKVEKIDSRRLVLQLNIADCLWGKQEFDASYDYYEKYKKLMIKSDKKNKIPARVIERLALQH